MLKFRPVMPPPRLALPLLAALAAPLPLATSGCRREQHLGTMQVGTSTDPKFDQAWRALGERGGDEGELFYIEDDRAEGLLARVRRAPRVAPRPAPPPAAAGGGHAPSGKERAVGETPSAEEVAAVVRANLPAVKTCYLRLTRAGSGVSGRAIVSFTVEKAGTVGDVRVEAPAFRDTGLPRCVSEQVQRWAFPQSKRGGLAVSYPFVFVGG
jgi:TonB family protein